MYNARYGPVGQAANREPTIDVHPTGESTMIAIRFSLPNLTQSEKDAFIKQMDVER